ncbi:MAG: hypothetical protein EBR30_07325 [Cytophagia bacterium]|nr:hypothetical protein [Cytophagia bacterium]NBW34818.1 hypothetical protein [Cytophagia bacterium]
MKILKVILFSVLLTSSIHATGQINDEQLIYSQKVTRECRIFDKPFIVKRGVLQLTKDSLIFKCKKEKLAKYNFSILYSDIKTIRPFYGFLYPNRINIRTKHGEWYRLFTYKKRSILKITRERIKSA